MTVHVDSEDPVSWTAGPSLPLFYVSGVKTLNPQPAWVLVISFTQKPASQQPASPLLPEEPAPSSTALPFQRTKAASNNGGCTFL